MIKNKVINLWGATRRGATRRLQQFHKFQIPKPKYQIPRSKIQIPNPKIQGPKSKHFKHFKLFKLFYPLNAEGNWTLEPLNIKRRRQLNLWTLKRRRQSPGSGLPGRNMANNLPDPIFSCSNISYNIYIYTLHLKSILLYIQNISDFLILPR